MWNLLEVCVYVCVYVLTWCSLEKFKGQSYLYISTYVNTIVGKYTCAEAAAEPALDVFFVCVRTSHNDHVLSLTVDMFACLATVCMYAYGHNHVNGTTRIARPRLKWIWSTCAYVLDRL